MKVAKQGIALPTDFDKNTKPVSPVTLRQLRTYLCTSTKELSYVVENKS